MRLPSTETSRFDILDTLRSDSSRAWSYREICEDTGRTLRSVQGVLSNLETSGLVAIGEHCIRPRRQCNAQITTRGLRWLWLVEQRVPPAHERLLIGLLELLEGAGPIETTTLGLKPTTTSRALRRLSESGYVQITKRKSLSRLVEITDQGLELLRLFRGLHAERLRRGDLTGLG